MKKFIQVFLCLFLAVSVAGCFTNPLDRLKRATAKVEAAQVKKEKIEEKVISKSVPYVFAGNYALEKDPEPSKWSMVAKNMIGSALTITGPPSFKDSLEFKQIVDGLLATNLIQIKSAEVKLAAKNQEVVALQGQIEGLGEKLTIVEKARDKIGEEAASLANKWVKWTRTFWFFVYGAIILFAIHLLSFLPPPYGNIFSLVSLFFGGIIALFKKVAPKSLEYGKVVGSEAYSLSEKSLRQIISGVQELRQDKKLADEVIDPVLKDHLDRDDVRKKVDQVKENMNLKEAKG